MNYFPIFTSRKFLRVVIFIIKKDLSGFYRMHIFHSIRYIDCLVFVFETAVKEMPTRCVYYRRRRRRMIVNHTRSNEITIVQWNFCSLYTTNTTVVNYHRSYIIAELFIKDIKPKAWRVPMDPVRVYSDRILISRHCDDFVDLFWFFFSNNRQYMCFELLLDVWSNFFFFGFHLDSERCFLILSFQKTH